MKEITKRSALKKIAKNLFKNENDRLKINIRRKYWFATSNLIFFFFVLMDDLYAHLLACPLVALAQLKSPSLKKKRTRKNFIVKE